MRVYGTIQDAHSEKKLPGALVTLSVGETDLIENSPAPDGYFSYDIPETAVPTRDDILTCSVVRNGYHKQTATYSLQEGDVEIDIELTPEKTDWRRILRISLIIFIILLILTAIGVGAYLIFFGPKPPPPVITQFRAQHPVISPGGETKILWTTIDAKDVFLDGKKVKPAGSEVVKPEKNTTYTLTVKDTDIPLEKKTKVTILPDPQIVQFTADPVEINLWDSSVLKWKTANTDSLYIKEGEEDESATANMITAAGNKVGTAGPKTISVAKKKPGAKKNLTGSAIVTPLETTTYTLVAVNSLGKKAVQEAKVTVLEPPEILTFSASAQVAEVGESVILTWKTSGAAQAFLNDQQYGVNYSKQVTAVQSCIYTLVVRNKVGERQRSITITVPQPPPEPEPVKPGPPPKPPEAPKVVSFRMTSTEIAIGQGATLNWVVSADAAEVYLITKNKLQKEIARIRVNQVGSQDVFPQKTAFYTVKAENITGEDTWTRKLEVYPTECTVILYDLENYAGEFSMYTVDAPQLIKLDNAVSSIKIIGDCRVRVFSAPHFKATRQDFVKSIPKLLGTWIGDNTISSIQIFKK